MEGKRKQLITAVLVVMVVVLIGIAVYYWFNNSYYISTEDARVTGDLVKVSPEVSGKLVEFEAAEGDRVVKDQILGRLEAVNLSDSNIDQSIVRAPISGTIIKKQANPGEFESSGQTLAYIIDPQKLYISANIEETDLSRVKPGQQVDITIDQFAQTRFSGKVKYVGQAANSAFSLLPASTSGTFTKVVQKVPVKIEFDPGNSQLLPGTNAVVKIHVK
ncbi:MAG TPA: HlyD family efflux transporter periplasmic adaptor subunit [Syntrophomonadaceae bacterium]|nr:HlyD family efflux transporter periplasmic adaptor subunit [Syntrophomonadaceae bacterium]